MITTFDVLLRCAWPTAAMLSLPPNNISKAESKYGFEPAVVKVSTNVLFMRVVLIVLTNDYSRAIAYGLVFYTGGRPTTYSVISIFSSEIYQCLNMTVLFVLHFISLRTGLAPPLSKVFFVTVYLQWRARGVRAETRNSLACLFIVRIV